MKSLEKNSVNILQIKSMSEVVDETKSYIRDRRSGKQTSLKVLSTKVNNSFLAGFDWNRIITIAGLSGSGKSTIMRQWIKEMIENNPDEDFDVLSFQFEMLGVDEAARDVSSKTHKSVKDIYSADKPLSEKDYNDVSKALDTLRNYPIFVVDNLGTVKEIKDTILYYVTTNDLAKLNKGLVVQIDHSLLVKPDGDRSDEKQILDDLMKMLVEIKKYLASIKVKCMFFVLSQLNRNIETTERVTNPKLHYPNKNDLFGASSVYYSSDYVMILHRPCLIDGLGNWYGPPRKNYPNGLPVFNPSNAKQPMIYLHIIKERFGNNRILPMLDELEHSKISDYMDK